MHLNGNPRIAVDFGVNVSIFVQKLAEWTFLNLANRTNLHDGACWSFNTLESYEEFFPWWSKRQLETLINNAVRSGLVKKGNYNAHKYDRTCWYSLTPKALSYYPELYQDKYLLVMSESISPNWEMYNESLSHDENMQLHFTELRKAIFENVTTIPTTNTTNNIISKDIIGKSEEPEIPEPKKPKKGNFGIKELKDDNPHDIPEQMLADWLDVRNTKKNKVTATAWNKINKTLTIIQTQLKISPQEAFETMVTRAWQSIELEYFQNTSQSSAGGTGMKDAFGNDITWE